MGTDWNELKLRCYNERGLGYADFFQDRHKRKMMQLADVRQSDVFYDLGCGDASVLIFGVKEFGLKKAVGFERDPSRRRLARQKISQEGLSNVISIKNEMYEADLSKADVILSMIMEYEDTHESLFRHNVRKGTRLIKHDLPLIGFDYDKANIPFYLIKFPLRRLRSPEEWAHRVMGDSKSSVEDVWRELYHYQYEKGYSKWDIRRFDRILRERFDV
jgi:cyclopropane fatty-acyl-phospholipid synthase-like methyltransferase